jgi:nucleotide-binding universal stress UspA family protein
MNANQGIEENVVRGSSVLDRVFVPVDYSMSSHRALGVALELMRTHGSDVCVFHAAESDGSADYQGGIGSPAVGGDWAAQALARLRRFLDNVAPQFAASVEVLARCGEPLVTMRHAAREWGASLIVAPASVHARVLRSPAERLVHETDVPVLVIPNDE